MLKDVIIDGTPNLLELVEALPVDPIEMLTIDVAMVLDGGPIDDSAPALISPCADATQDAQG